ncbi:FliA/WhiG family RNA polymerase sigma factor, partial [Bovifimicola ammoniilytica]|uniref:FliA/WhiG family RNA polymerase sigma factor n=1 Tax=Bovifimicola ammoniilytica TaxID=2981720 RepID=UPI0011C929CF
MDENSRNHLWKEYMSTKNSEIRDKIILEYAPLVKIVAGRLSIYLGYNVEYDDLVGYGIFGLIDAIDKFDYDKGVKFETYASLRIRGAILDQIRKMDWIPRSLRQKQKKMEAAISKIETQYGRPAKDEEIASELGIETEELISWQGQAKITNIISLDEFVEAAGEKEVNAIKSNSYEQPESIALKNEIKQQLMDSLETLTDKERKVILLYYYEELTLKEISKILEVSESRVSQLHTKALQKMKVKLGDYMEIL